jgi:hypothetical protein
MSFYCCWLQHEMHLAICSTKSTMAGRRLLLQFERPVVVGGGIIAPGRALHCTTTRSMNRTTDIRVSPGEADASAIIAQATELIEERGWTLSPDGKGLERDFRFPTFVKTWVGEWTSPRRSAREIMA